MTPRPFLFLGVVVDLSLATEMQTGRGRMGDMPDEACGRSLSTDIWCDVCLADANDSNLMRAARDAIEAITKEDR